MAEPADKVFVREATGLVREVGFLEGTLFNINGIGPLFTLASLSFLIWYAAAGADIIAVVLIAGAFGVFGLAVTYSFLMSSMPRAGGDYVFQSRILHPALAFVVETCYWVGQAASLATIPVALTIWYTLSPFLYSLGLKTGDPGIVGLATQLTSPVNSTILGTVILVLVGLLSISGTKVMLRYFQIPLSIIGFVGFLVILYFTGTTSPAAFQSSVNHLMSLSGNVTNGYQSVISTATANGYDSTIRYTPALILTALAFTVGSNNAIWTAFIGGEMKKANAVRRNWLSMSIGGLVTMFTIIVSLIVLYHSAGYQFLSSLNFILTTNPASFPGGALISGSAIPFAFFLTAPNVPVLYLELISMLAIGVLIYPIFTLMLSRIVLAMSFDRVYPAFLSDVNPRFHTPVKALVFILLVSEVFIILLSFDPSIIGPLLVLILLLFVVGIFSSTFAATIFPWRRKALWSSSPASRYKIGGVPVVTLGGIIAIAYLLVAIVVYLTNPFDGFVSSPTARGLAVGLYVGSLIVYVIVRVIRKRQSINLDAVFSEIPPE